MTNDKGANDKGMTKLKSQIEVGLSLESVKLAWSSSELGSELLRGEEGVLGTFF
jgi:hypothetical protein